MKVIIGIISAALAYWLVPATKSLWGFLIAAAITYFILTKLVAAVVRYRKAIIGTAAAAAAIAVFSGVETVGSIIVIAVIVIYFVCAWGALLHIFSFLTDGGSRTAWSDSDSIAHGFDLMEEEKKKQAEFEDWKRRKAESDYWFHLKKEEHHRDKTGDSRMEEYHRNQRRTAYDNWTK